MKKLFVITIFWGFLFAGDEKINDYFGTNSGKTYGAFFGINASSVFGSNTKNIIYKAGLVGGICIVRNISDNLHLRLGLYYISRGYKTSRIKDTDYLKKTHRYYFITEYLDFPILLQFYMPVNNIEMNWVFGFAPSLTLSTKQKTKIDGKVISTSYTDKNRLLDINIIVGMNKMLNQHFNLDFRASAGLLPINPKTDFLDGKRNISFVLSLGYFL